MAQKKQNIAAQQNTVETFKSLSTGVAKNTLKTFGDIGAGIGKGMLDSFTGATYAPEKHEKTPQNAENKPGNFQRKGEFKTLYNFQAEQERKTIRELTRKIHEEIKALKEANSSLAQEVSDIEKITLSSAAEKPGIYHIHFLELVLSFIKTLREKIGDSSTWLAAMQSKKKKRGSAFAANAKKKGTQYSMSEEHKITRSTQ